MKRTTLRLADRRLIELKRLAAARGETLSAVVDQLLAEGIRRANIPKRSGAPTLPVYNMGEPKVNINDRKRLWEAMKGE